MRHAWILLLLGCGGSDEQPDTTPKGPDKAKIHEHVMGYVESCEKADATKTHASGDHLMATQAADKHENELRSIVTAGHGDAVRSDIDTKRGECDKERERLEGKINTLKVVGRQLTPAEMKWLDEEAPREVRRQEFRIKTLDQLKSKLGL
jgi:hypothetical protein